MKTSRPSQTPFQSIAALFIASQLAAVAGGVVSSPTESDLRAALVGGGIVTFSVSGTITLSNTIVITNATTMDGNGQSVVISGGNAVRVFQVNTNVGFAMMNLTVSNGRTNQGGAIYNAGGSVTVSNCVVSANQARGADGTSGLSGGPGSPAAGGAFYNLGSLALLDSAFNGNSAVGGSGGSAAFTVGGSGAEGSGGVVYSLGNVAMTNCSFSGNNASGGSGGFGASNSGPGGNGNAFGGVIYCQNVSILSSNCNFSTNSAVAGNSPGSKSGSYRGIGRGGVIYNATGPLIIASSSFNYNTSVGSPSSGGGIHHGGGSMNLLNTKIAFNVTTADRTTLGITGPGSTGLGGGIYNAGTATLTDCTVSSNSVSGGVGVSALGSGSGNGGDGQGGGCYNSGSMSVTRCALIGNMATGGAGAGVYSGGSGLGGGMFTAGSAPLVNCTLAFNSTASVGGGSAGGGIYGGSTLTNCTFYNNLAIGGNGGNLAYAGATVNTIVAAGFPNNTYGPFVNVGNNVVSGGNPGLGMPGNYGGNTQTMPLLQGSPALDGANNASAPVTDQRGRSRPSGGASDVGAFESSAPYVVAGRFTGLSPSDTIGITMGSQTTNISSGFSFRFDSVSSGTHTISVSNFNLAVVPNPRVVNLGPDILNADFAVAPTNALRITASPNNHPLLLYAGSNGQTFRLLASSNLVDWIAITTNTIGSVLYSEYIDLGDSGQPARFYRSTSP